MKTPLLLLLGMLLPMTVVAAPAEVDLRPRFAAYGLPPRAQGARDTCSLFALVGVLEFEYAGVEASPVRLSEEFLNWASHQTNGRSQDGSFFSDGLNGLRAYGVCRNSLMPYAPTYNSEAAPSGQARQEALVRRAVTAVWIKRWDAKTGLTEGQLSRIRQTLAEGHPVAAGMRWPKREQYGPGHLMLVPSPDAVFDGHSVILVGYRDDPSQPGGGSFLFRNSSGPAWRDGGYARLPYAYAAAYVNDALTLRLGALVNRPTRTPLEAEALRIEAARECAASVQAMNAWGADRWSGGAQLFCAARQGGGLTLLLPVKEGGRYRVRLYATRAPDFGTLRFTLDDRPLGEPFDGYSPEVEPSGPVLLGTVTLAAGERRLRVEVIGKNAASRGYFAGMDCVELEPN